MNISEILSNEPDLAAAARRLRDDPDSPFPVLCAKFKLTWDCNLKCGMCNIWRRDDTDRRARRLEAPVVMDAVTALHALGLRKVHFSGGEVLLHPGFRDIVSHARTLGLQVNITTNGTLLYGDNARFIIDSRVHAVNVSIDSGEEKVHDAMRGVKGAWKLTWKGMRDLLERSERKGRGPVVSVNTLVTRDSAPTLGALHAMLVEAGVDNWRLLGVDTEDKRARATKEQWAGIIEKMPSWKPLLGRAPVGLFSEKGAALAEKGLYAGKFYEGRPCFAPWFNLFVDADGSAYPCCMGKLDISPLGSLGESRADEIVTGARAREVRCTMATGHNFPACARCDDFLEENAAFAALCER